MAKVAAIVAAVVVVAEWKSALAVELMFQVFVVECALLNMCVHEARVMCWGFVGFENVAWLALGVDVFQNKRMVVAGAGCVQTLFAESCWVLLRL